MNHMFLTRDSVDVLPAVLRSCQPGRHPRRYITALIELVHVSYKVCITL
jgi:hypothetical protein